MTKKKVVEAQRAAWQVAQGRLNALRAKVQRGWGRKTRLVGVLTTYGDCSNPECGIHARNVLRVKGSMGFTIFCDDHAIQMLGL